MAPWWPTPTCSLPVDRRELADMSDDLAPYYRLIANGLPAVMVAHVLFPAVDSHARKPFVSLDPRRVARRSQVSGRSVF